MNLFVWWSPNSLKIRRQRDSLTYRLSFGCLGTQRRDGTGQVPFRKAKAAAERVGLRCGCRCSSTRDSLTRPSRHALSTLFPPSAPCVRAWPSGRGTPPGWDGMGWDVTGDRSSTVQVCSTAMFSGAVQLLLAVLPPLGRRVCLVRARHRVRFASPLRPTGNVVLPPNEAQRHRV